MIVFLSNLPPDSATERALAGEAAGWDVRTELLAGVVDLLNRLNWAVWEVPREKGTRTKPPKPITRPWLSHAPKVRQGGDW